MSDRYLLMYDATPGGVDSIPENAEAVAGYVDGNYQSFPALCRRFYPRAHCVSINVFLGNLAAFSDVEPGNPINTPTKVRADFQFKRAHGVWRPGYYADMTRMHDTVLPGLAGIPRSEYRLWLANWNGSRSVEPGFDAHQFTNNRRQGRDGPYDTSIVDIERFFPSRKPVPNPPKPVHPPLKPHPKVVTGTVVGAGSTGLAAALNAIHGLHLTPAEVGAFVTFLSAFAAYMKSGRL